MARNAATKSTSNTSNVDQLIIESKIALLREFPFMSFLVMSTRYQQTEELPTMAACVMGGTPTVLYNAEFTCNTLKNEQQRAFVIAHEILHLFLQHIGRQVSNNYNRLLWNIATDYCINSYLQDLQSRKIEMPDNCLYDVKFKDLSADEIYAKLLEEADGNLEKFLSRFGEPGSGDKNSPLDAVGTEELTADEQAQMKAQLAASLGNGDPKTMGSGAAKLFRKLKELVEPKIDWRQVLRDYIISSSKYRYTFNKYNRRSGEVIFPSLTGDYINIAIGVDTSGSMGDKELREALGEIKGIVTNFDAWTVDLLSCDTEAHWIGHYDTDSGDDFSTISTELIGGGGTDMNPMVIAVEDMEQTPNVLVIITDGVIPKLQGSATVPTIVVVTSNGNTEFEHTQIEKIIRIDN